jgi:hypothetical protein
MQRIIMLEVDDRITERFEEQGFILPWAIAEQINELKCGGEHIPVKVFGRLDSDSDDHLGWLLVRKG